MKNTLISKIALCGTLFFSTLSFADEGVAGKWNASMDTPQGAMELTFDFAVNGSQLSGSAGSESMGMTEISEGMVDGNAISFKQTVQGPQGSMTISYSGKLEGDSLTIELSMEGMPAGMMPPIVAKRAG